MNSIHILDYIMNTPSVFTVKPNDEYNFSDHSIVNSMVDSVSLMITELFSFSWGGELSLSYSFAYTSVSLWTDDFYLTVSQNSYVDLSFTWSWSASITPDILFTLVNINAETRPDWVFLDATNQKLFLNETPTVSSITKYQFGLSAQYETTIADKRFYISVAGCAVKNCKTCDIKSGKWTVCYSGYDLSSDALNCIKANQNTTSSTGNSNNSTLSGEMSTPQTATQAILGVGVGLSIGSSLLSMSSPQGAFSMINQFQMLILIPMIGSYIPNDVVVFITGMDFALLSFDFIPFEKIPLIGYIFEIFAYSQRFDYFSDIGLRSGSAFINQLKLMSIIFLTFLIHLCWVPLFIISNKMNSGIFKWIIDKLFKIMTFSIYIRCILEAFLLIWLSIVFEINAFRTEDKVRSISLGLSFVFLVFIVFFFSLWIGLILKNYPAFNQENVSYFSEYFEGLKLDLKSQIFPLLFMFQRAICWVLLIVGKNLNFYCKSGAFTIIQIWQLIYLLAARPFIKVKDMLIEVSNHFIYSALCSLLIYYNSESDWNSVIKWIFIFSIIAGSLICSIVLLVDFIITIIQKVMKWFSSSRVENYRQTKVQEVKSNEIQRSQSNIDFSSNIQIWNEEEKWEAKNPIVDISKQIPSYKIQSRLYLNPLLYCEIKSTIEIWSMEVNFTSIGLHILSFLF